MPGNEAPVEEAALKWFRGWVIPSINLQTCQVFYDANLLP